MNIINTLIPKVLAVTTPPIDYSKATLDGPAITTIINNITSWMLYVLIAAAGIMITVAAFEYLLSGGSPAKIDSAKNKILYAAVGIVVGILAKSVGLLVTTIVK